MATKSKSKAKNKLSPAKKKQLSKTRSGDKCPHCAGGPETYGYLKRAYVYDVDLARAIVSDGREAVELDDTDVAYLVDNSRIHQQHLDHVDTQYPGILAHLWGPGEGGTWEHGHLLIDGNHRAARCLRDGLPFRAYLMSEFETECILKRGACQDGRVMDN